MEYQNFKAGDRRAGYRSVYCNRTGEDERFK